MKFVGMDMVDAVAFLRKIGATVTVARRSGEFVIEHPKYPQAGRMRVNCRRKDVSRSVSVYMKNLVRLIDRHVTLTEKPIEPVKIDEGDAALKLLLQSAVETVVHPDSDKIIDEPLLVQADENRGRGPWRGAIPLLRPGDIVLPKQKTPQPQESQENRGEMIGSTMPFKDLVKHLNGKNANANATDAKAKSKPIEQPQPQPQPQPKANEGKSGQVTTIWVAEEEKPTWDQWPISRLGLNKSIVDSLAIEGIHKLADLLAYTKLGCKLTDIQGINNVRADEISDRIFDFWQQHPESRPPEMAALKEVAKRDPKPETKPEQSSPIPSSQPPKPTPTPVAAAPVVPTPVPIPVTVEPAPHIVQASAKGDLASEIRALIEVRERVQKQSIDRLRQLQTDRTGILEMLSDVNKEIATLVDELQTAGITIPFDLLPRDIVPAQLQSNNHYSDMSQPILAPYATTGTPALMTTTEGAVDDDGPEPADDTNDDRELPPIEDRVMQFMEENDGMWFLGREIMEALGIEFDKPAKVLSPLVEKGKLVRIGSSRSTRYKFQPPP